MGEELEQHARNGRGPGFAVGTVPGLAARPFRLVLFPDVLDNLRLYQVRQQASVETGFPVGQFILAVAKPGVDGERTDGGVVGGQSGIAVECQGQVERDLPSCRRRVHPGPAAQLGHPAAAAGIILGIIVLPVVEKVRVDSRPGHLIQGPFGEAGQTGEFAVPLHFSHAAAEADGVGANDAAGGAPVGQFHVSFIPPVEREGAEINPGASAHPLVDMPPGNAPHMVDVIAGVRRAVGEGLIGYVDGIFAAFGNVGTPESFGFPVGIIAGRGLAHAGGAERERIVIQAVHRFPVSEPLLDQAPGAGLLVMAGTAHEGMPVAGESGVVVADDLPGLGIPLARGQDAGTGVLQHGDQEGEDVTLGVHVLDGAVDGGPLPFPPARFGFIVAPVALPECDVAGGKPLGPAFFTADERDGFPAGIGGPEGIRQRFSVVGKCRNRKFGKTVVLAAVDFAESVGAVALGHQFPELVLEPFDVTWPPGIVH